MSRQQRLLFILLLALLCNACSKEPTYPDLRDSHDPELQAELDAALADRSRFWDGVKKRDLSVVIADVTDLQHPKVAWYNPDLMLYAASMSKIAIALAALVEIDIGNLELDDELHQQLVNVKHQPCLLSDNGPCYIAGELSDYLAAKGMTHTRGRPYHPKTQGKIERWHRSMKSQILLENYCLPDKLRLRCCGLLITTITRVIMSRSTT